LSRRLSQTLGVRSTKPCKSSSSKQCSCSSSEFTEVLAYLQMSRPLSFHRRRGLSVLRRPARAWLSSTAASNILSLRAASRSVTASQRLTSHWSGLLRSRSIPTLERAARPMSNVALLIRSRQRFALWASPWFRLSSHHRGAPLRRSPRAEFSLACAEAQSRVAGRSRRQFRSRRGRCRAL
jgi:hypothetical protein